MNEGRRARVFCASWADVFEDWSGPILDSKGRRLCLFEDGKTIKPLLECECPNSRWRFLTMDDCRRDLFRLIDATPRLDWLLLTKRPENIRRMVPYFDGAEMSGDLQYRHNVWYGTTTENQKYADERIHHLVHGCRDLSPVLFVSAEPLLGELRLQHDFDGEKVRNWLGEGGINWVISGGESGPKARPSHPDWHRSLRDQCVAAGVPFHFKQWGEFAPVDNGMALGGIHAFADSEDCVMRVDKKAAGRLLDGKLWDQFPCD
jgi:protein gp37